MANTSHKRDTNARPRNKRNLLAAGVACAITGVAVTSGIALAQPSALVASPSPLPTLSAEELAERADLTSRADSRDESLVVEFNSNRLAKRIAITSATRKAWATEDLNLYIRRQDSARPKGELASGTKVLLTGRRHNKRVEIVYKDRAYWVTRKYLSAEKPLIIPEGVSGAPCPDGSVERGLTRRAVVVYRAVCNAFPQITTYSGWDNHGEHSSGRALDIMVSGELGWAVANYLRAHASELGLYDVIYAQRIWTPERGGEGWRLMPDRGSATANHFDHVHVAVY